MCLEDWWGFTARERPRNEYFTTIFGLPLPPGFPDIGRSRRPYSKCSKPCLFLLGSQVEWSKDNYERLALPFHCQSAHTTQENRAPRVRVARASFYGVVPLVGPKGGFRSH